MKIQKSMEPAEYDTVLAVLQRFAALADLITRHEAHDGRIPACQLRAVLGMPARDRGER